ncbi:hypothetical protein CN918_26785 [Priestia megaterium]|nr:hypothetical protein CN918_26785 [Priestia megaterium]
MHSKDFRYQVGHRIDNKDQKEWEKEFYIASLISYLNVLGWDHYIWNYECDVDMAKNQHLQCYAEFYSPYYNGCLRGDSRNSLQDAVQQCLHEAQMISACEAKTGHFYEGKASEHNNLIECIHCGFNGYSPLVKNLKEKVASLEQHVQQLQEKYAHFIRNAEREGLHFNYLAEVIHQPPPLSVYLVYQEEETSHSLVGIYSSEEKAIHHIHRAELTIPNIKHNYVEMPIDKVTEQKHV